MADVTIRLEVDRTTGKKTVVISYEADEGALPLEHEEEHRRIVDRLIEGGAIKAGELGRIVVEREQEKPIEAPAAAEERAEREKAGQKS